MFAFLEINISLQIDILICRIVVATLHQVCVFSFPAPTQHLFTFETRLNKHGLCEVSPLLTAERHLVAFPAHKVGSVQLVDLCSTDVGSSSAPVTINAHQAELVCLAINQKGTMLATASSKGTLIRVWDTSKRHLLHELRRGSDPALLYWLVILNLTIIFIARSSFRVENCVSVSILVKVLIFYAVPVIKERFIFLL